MSDNITMRFNSVGLLTDDLHNEYDPAVEEAVRRLPEKEAYLRLYRIKRALDLNLKGAELPKSQWTTPEQVSSGMLWSLIAFGFAK